MNMCGVGGLITLMPRELVPRLCEERAIISNNAAPTCASVYGYGDKLEGHM